jgi:hypothetical protein
MNYLQRIGYAGLLIVALVVVYAESARGEIPKVPLKFEEVFSLVKSNLFAVGDADLNQVAIEGFLTQLQPRVLLVTSELLDQDRTNAVLLTKTNVYDGAFAYLRVVRVAEGLASAIDQACDRLISSNKLKGLVLDLRYARGSDYAAAGAVADLFLSSEQLLLDWGTASARSTAKSTSLSLPLMILANEKTAGAAEALAAVLRQYNVGLVIGKKTAGAAEIYKEFTLTNGIRLLIAVAPVKLEGSQALSRDGVEPDILVAVSEEDEKAYWEDPYRAISKRGSRAVSAGAVPPPGESSKIAQTSRRRMNEADLVRMQREGMDPDLDLPEVSSKTAESEKMLVRDPALARALDLLKGLAVVKQLRQP